MVKLEIICRAGHIAHSDKPVNYCPRILKPGGRACKKIIVHKQLFCSAHTYLGAAACPGCTNVAGPPGGPQLLGLLLGKEERRRQEKLLRKRRHRSLRDDCEALEVPGHQEGRAGQMQLWPEMTPELIYQEILDRFPLRDWIPGDPVPDEWFKSIYSEIPGRPGNYDLDEERLMIHFQALANTIRWQTAPPRAPLIELVPLGIRGLLRYYLELARDIS
jgi:hypothetical protein